ncbi:MBOAT family O-acyltransferase [Sinorhizobium meliloti]|uniref:MBOAT family O-acyltransferase n=1 Tax=Rhizobium meliloti TaxID=382 RepID=UPI000B4A08BF|nr:MBOAT family protein [Sinorhizobium meliloti]ASP92075.1 MBOAT family protein [Sinorhizobium meliloti]MQX57047.1 MBOAT family protein [Sinorhizobium meliloti]
MIFIDPLFLFLFLPVTLIAFYLALLTRGRNEALLVIFTASIIFYAPYGISSVFLLLVALLVNFGVSNALLATDDSNPYRRVLYGCGQGYNIASLCYFKYKIVTVLLGDNNNFLTDIAGVAIPAGISFYTFHQAAFLADAYVREKSVVEFFAGTRSLRSGFWAFCRYGAFVSFFPQLIIGPITYLHEFHPQVKSRKFISFDPLNIAVGLAFISIGMFKKVVIADNIAPTVDLVFGAAGAGAVMDPAHAWIGALSYMAQLYFDFSGYSDMALGLARMFGLRYPLNFYSPFKANGILDYYRRWNMTLTRVIARFLFTPLSIAGTRYCAVHRLSPLPTQVLSLWLPMLINFQVLSLWHGAAWTFVAFGLMQGVWSAAEAQIRGSKKYKRMCKSTSPFFRLLVERAIFFMLICLSLAMFRSESVGAAFHLYAQMFGASLDAPSAFEMREPVLMLFCAFSIIYLMPNAVELMRRYRPAMMTYENESYGFAFLRSIWRPSWGWAAFAAILTISSLHYVSRQPPFLYQGF